MQFIPILNTFLRFNCFSLLSVWKITTRSWLTKKHNKIQQNTLWPNDKKARILTYFHLNNFRTQTKRFREHFHFSL